MHPFPHRYTVTALAQEAGVVTLRGDELEDIQSTPPPEFDGPPGNWSPESLFVAAVVYTNANGVLNDGIYEYEEVADPFLAAVGEVVGRELAR